MSPRSTTRNLFPSSRLRRALPVCWGALAYIAGFTSTLGAMIAGSNSQARLIFNAAREGLLPSWIARVHSQRRTPWVSFLVFFGIGLATVYIFGWTVDPVV